MVHERIPSVGQPSSTLSSSVLEAETGTSDLKGHSTLRPQPHGPTASSISMWGR